MKYCPHDYQRFATDFVLEHPCCGLILDMGLGKSVITLTALWNACAAEIPRSGRAPSEILDRALAERALPAVLASASMEALTALPKLLEDFPRCRALLRQPLPIRY